MLSQATGDDKHPFYKFRTIPEFMCSYQMSYCFPLNFNTANHEIVG